MTPIQSFVRRHAALASTLTLASALQGLGACTGDSRLTLAGLTGLGCLLCLPGLPCRTGLRTGRVVLHCSLALVHCRSRYPQHLAILYGIVNQSVFAGHHVNTHAVSPGY